MFRELVIAKRQAKRLHDRDVTLAWNTAHLTAAAAVGKLKPLATLLAARTRQTAQDHHNALRVLSEQTGIPARQVKRSSLKLVQRAAS